jgi:orotidine-5'-phosphate decarboxylase
MTIDSTQTAAVPESLRSRLALALDLDDMVAATRLARDLQPWFGTMKVGMELFSAAGPDAIATLSALGADVFYDGKLHDIPNTVRRTSRVLGALGARYVTLHTSGGVAMLRAGVEGLREGAAGAGLPEPTALAVTVLTSDPDWSEHLVRQRVVAGLEAGCGGFVCSVLDLPILRELAPAATIVTPGIRPEGAAANDQARVGTPQAALDAGADLLVVGRAVVQTPDPIKAARELVAPLLP